MRLVDIEPLIDECDELISIEWNYKVAPPSWAEAEEEFRQRLLDAPVIESEWVNIAHGKPPCRGHYFIAYKFQGSDMRFYGEAFWHDDIPDNGYVKGDHFSNEGVNGMYVTHWMKIPKLPNCGAKIDGGDING